MHLIKGDKMKKKILFLVIFVFFVSGCEINYNLEIKDDKYTESVSATAIPEKESDEVSLPSELFYKSYEKKPIPLFTDTIMQSESNKKIDGVKYYNSEDLSNGNLVGMKYTGDFTYNDFQKSYMVNYAYNRFLIATVDNNTILSTGEHFKLFEQFENLDKVNITIKTNHKVIENNADEVNGDKYIWHVTKEDAKNKSIYLKMSKEAKSSGNIILLKFALILLGIVLIIGAVFFIIKAKGNKNNKL